MTSATNRNKKNVIQGLNRFYKGKRPHWKNLTEILKWTIKHCYLHFPVDRRLAYSSFKLNKIERKKPHDLQVEKGISAGAGERN